MADSRRRRGGADPARLDLHQGLVGARTLIGTPYLGDPRLRSAYAATIAPRTGAALGKILTEVAPSPDPQRRWRVLDLGAGTGAAAEAFRAHLGANTEVVLVDRVPAPGVVVADLERTDVPPRLEGRFEFVVAAHVLNELHVHEPSAARIAARVHKVLAWSRRLLADDGLLVLIEPALKETSRELLEVRDQVIACGLTVVAPCLWTGPCPALARERDWCHDTASRPDAMRAAGRVDFSYLVLATRPRPTAPDPALFRIVSTPLVEKGRLRIYGCGPTGRHPLVRLDRHHSKTNALFDDLERGDLAQIAPTAQANDGLRLTSTTAVTRAR
jgi:ribosomal protein RSM22 (predicted rRNA methylase)